MVLFWGILLFGAVQAEDPNAERPEEGGGPCNLQKGAATV